jgi:type II secretion system protein G
MQKSFTLFELIVVLVILGLFIGILSPFVVAHLKRARIIATKDKMEALNEALQLYYECQFDLPSSLSSLEPNYIRSREYSGDYMEDAWRNTIVYNKSDSKTATLTSYGPNRTSGGGDDIVCYVDCTAIYKEYKRETQDALRVISESALEYVENGGSLDSSLTSDDATFSQYLPTEEYKYDPWGTKSEPGALRGNGQPYHYSSTKNTFYSCGPDGTCGSSDDIYPLGVP